MAKWSKDCFDERNVRNIDIKHTVSLIAIVNLRLNWNVPEKYNYSESIFALTLILI